MNKLIKIALSAALILSVGATSSFASADKGQKLFTKKLKKPCGITGAAMAGKHTQSEWSELKEENKIADEIKKICPAVTGDDLKEEYLEHYYDFFHEYGSDSGNVPAC
jgi:hypothetical protein